MTGRGRASRNESERPSQATVSSGDVPRPRLLVIRLRRLGDVLLTTPVLRAVRRTWPACRLAVAVQTGFDAVLRGNPHVDEIIVVRPGLRGWLAAMAVRGCYDKVLDLQSSSRTVALVLASRAAVRVGWRKRRLRDRAYTSLVAGWDAPDYFARKMLRAAEAIGVTHTDDTRPELPVSAADRQRAAALLAGAGIDAERPIIGLSVVAKVPYKQWPPAAYAVLADRMIEQHRAQIILTHGPGELSQVQQAVAAMRHRPALWRHPDTTLAELAAIYECCTLWVGNDGGPKHVATAAGCPTVTIITSGPDAVWTDAADPMQMAVTPPPGAEPTRPLQSVSVEQVCAAAETLLERRLAASLQAQSGSST
jgi:heptosyltransferase-3